MSSNGVVDKPTDRRIEVFASPSGNKVLYCGLCRENTYEGQLACCDWSVKMVDKYFGGNRNVASLALSE